MLCQATHCTGRMSNVSLIASFQGPFWPGSKTIETTPLHRVWWYMCMMLTIQKYNQNTEFHFCRGMLLLLSDHFSKDAADAPDINWSGVVLRAQQQLWWSVPQCDDLERNREGKGERGGRGKGRKGLVKKEEGKPVAPIWGHCMFRSEIPIVQVHVLFEGGAYLKNYGTSYHELTSCV